MKTKIIKIIILILVCISGLYISKAENISKEEYKLKIKYSDSLIKYENHQLWNLYVYYEKDGVEYPAYCLNKDLPGVGEYTGGDYIVTPKQEIIDMVLWRLFINGYPYKSIQEMGCQTKEEAYTATYQASQIILYNYNISEYEAINEGGQRVLNAMKKLINIAKNGSNVKVSPYLTISPISSKWETDSKNSKYVYQEYVINNSEINGKYRIEFRSIIPESSMIADINGNPKNEFSNGEHFKVLVPIEEMDEDDSFIIVATANIKTMPIYDAFPKQENYQNYALTHKLYETAIGQLIIDYKNNKSNLTIIKKDEETGEKLKNAVFNLLDENKNIIKFNLVTDKQGEIKINNILPGTYYLEEVSPPFGYQKINELIKLQIRFNQNLTVNINNSEIKQTEISNSTGVINVTSNYEENITNNENYEENIELNERTDINVLNEETKNQTNTKVNQTENKSNIEENINNAQTQINNSQNNKVKEETNTSLKQSQTITNRNDEIKNSIEEKQNSIISLTSKVLPKTGM